MKAWLKKILFYCLLTGPPTLFSQSADKSQVPPRYGPAISTTLLRTRLHNNIYEDPVIRSFEARLYFLNRARFRLSLGAEYEPPVDLWPEWLRTKSWMFDLQAYFVAPVSEHFSLYAFTGITCQKFSGYYTGHANIIHLLPYVNKNYEANYFGGLIGFGLECRLVKGLSVYIEIRDRLIGNNEKLGHIKKDPTLIAQSGVGIRYELPHIRLKKIFRNPNDKYHWF